MVSGPSESPHPEVSQDAATWRESVAAPGFMRASVVTYAFSALTLLANLISGVVSARALGPTGRGVTVALVTITQLGGFLFSMGAAQSLSYFIARAPKDAPSLFTTWMLMLLPCTLVAVGAGELLLGALFSHHSPGAVATGRWFMFTAVLVVASELNNGLLLGAHDFTFYNALRFAQPALMAASFLVLWRLGALHVTSALIAPTAATGLILAVGMARSVRAIGIGRVDVRLGLHTLWYGIRGQGSVVATHVNARLDVAMLPAFVAASSVGLYSVATNVSLIVYQLSNTLASLVLPAAAREPERAPSRIIAALYGSMLVAGLLALGIAVLAHPLLSLVYGDRFRTAAFTLRLLLPGAVLFAGASIAGAGLYAAGRPFVASMSQIAAAVVTVIGLVLFLHRGGIEAAALVSSTAYATSFAIAIVAYKRVSRIPWRMFWPSALRRAARTQ